MPTTTINYIHYWSTRNLEIREISISFVDFFNSKKRISFVFFSFFPFFPFFSFNSKKLSREIVRKTRKFVESTDARTEMSVELRPEMLATLFRRSAASFGAWGALLSSMLFSRETQVAGTCQKQLLLKYSLAKIGKVASSRF